MRLSKIPAVSLELLLSKSTINSIILQPLCLLSFPEEICCWLDLSELKWWINEDLVPVPPPPLPDLQVNGLSAHTHTHKKSAFVFVRIR